MRIRLILITLVTIIFSLDAMSYASTEVTNYRLMPILKEQNLTALEVELEVQANADGTTVLELPDNYGGGTALYESINDLTIEGAETIDTLEPAKRLIQSNPMAKLVIRYRIDANLKKGQRIPYENDNTYPLIGPDFFYIQGPTIFATIKGRKNSPARFQWENATGWTFASDLERLDMNGATMSSVAQSVMLCGKDVKVTTRNLRNTELRIAYLGRFPFSTEELNTKAIKAIKAAQQFWGDGQKAYLITIASSQDNSQFGGASLGDAFAMTVPDRTPINELSLVLLHEYFHSWNPHKLYKIADDKDQIKLYWFQEGFTDYYTRKLALRSGLINLNEFILSWNKMFYDYSKSPVKNAPNDQIVEGFWENPYFMQLPYQRGAIFAANLNFQLHEHGGGIDQFMLELRNEVEAEGKNLPDEDETTIMKRFIKVANQFGVDIASDYKRYIETGEDIVLPENAFSGCIHVEITEMPEFDVGFNAEKSMASGSFLEVDPEGPAYAAGLRDGMKRIERLSGEWGNSDAPVSYRVLDNDGKEQIITYLPRGKKKVAGQKLIIPEGLSENQLATCSEEVASF